MGAWESLPGVAKILIDMYKGLYNTGSTNSFFLKECLPMLFK